MCNNLRVHTFFTLTPNGKESQSTKGAQTRKMIKPAFIIKATADLKPHFILSFAIIFSCEFITVLMTKETLKYFITDATLRN